MNQPTTSVVARPPCAPSVFAPGGATWVPVPVGLDGPALHAWIAIMRCRRGILITAPDRVLAAMAGRSPRTIQEGLRQLEQDGLIERTRRRGARVITITTRLAGASTDSQPAAKPYRRPPAAPMRRPAQPPSYGGETSQKQAVPPVPPSRPVGPAERDDPPCPAFTRFFARIFPEPYA